MWETWRFRLEDVARRAGVRDAPPQAVLAVLVLCGAAVVWAAWRWWPATSAPAAIPAPAPVSGAVPATRTREGSSTAAARITVHVVGAVRRPGVYELAADACVIDAVDAAGGLLPDAVASGVNLARAATDGEQILVPSEDDAAASPSATAAPATAAGAASDFVDLNSADLAALDALPGIGPSTAQKILDEREKNGPYSGLEDLGRVSGIGPKKLEQLEGLAGVR